MLEAKLTNAVLQKWLAISQDIMKKAIDSSPGWIFEVIYANRKVARQGKLIFGKIDIYVGLDAKWNPFFDCTSKKRATTVQR